MFSKEEQSFFFGITRKMEKEIKMAQINQTQTVDPNRNMKIMASIFIPICILIMAIFWVLFFFEIIVLPNSAMNILPLVMIPFGILVMCIVLALIWLNVLTFPMKR